jgi:hypothetical protein
VPSKHNGRLGVELAKELLGGRARASPLRREKLDKNPVARRVVGRAGGEKQKAENS